MQQQGRVRIGLSLLVWFVQHSQAPCINREEEEKGPLSFALSI